MNDETNRRVESIREKVLKKLTNMNNINQHLNTFNRKVEIFERDQNNVQ